MKTFVHYKYQDTMKKSSLILNVRYFFHPQFSFLVLLGINSSTTPFLLEGAPLHLQTVSEESRVSVKLLKARTVLM